jgi:tetratricopeptide (TPR) repeat protein
MSRELADRDGERNALRSLGMMRWHEGRNDDALRIVQEAVDLDRDREDLEALVGDLHNLGTILKSMKRYDEALASLNEALHRCIELADPIGEGYATHAVANIHRELGDIERAREYHHRADRVAIAARKPVLRSFALMALASIALEEGAPDEALGLYQELIDIGRKARHAEGLAQALRARGDVLLGMGQTSEAIVQMKEAAGLFAQMQDAASELAAIEGMLSALPLDRGAPEIEQWTLRALELAEALDDARKQVSLRNSLGILAWERGDFPRALEHYERARELLRGTSQRADEGLVLNSLGVTLNRLGRHEDARRVLLESVALNETTGQRLLKAHALAALGDTCAAAGHPGPARQYYEEAIAIRTDLGHADAAERLAGRVRELKSATVEEVS